MMALGSLLSSWSTFLVCLMAYILFVFTSKVRNNLYLALEKKILSSEFRSPHFLMQNVQVCCCAS